MCPDPDPVRKMDERPSLVLLKKRAPRVTYAGYAGEDRHSSLASLLRGERENGEKMDTPPRNRQSIPLVEHDFGIATQGWR